MWCVKLSVSLQAKPALWLGLLLLVVDAGAAPAESPADAIPGETANYAYHLSVGDRIKVNVLGQPDLSVELRVSDTGEIIYPLLGAVEVVGLTREQVEALLYDMLKPDYLVEPVLSVTILSYRQIFLQGEVKKTGPYPYTPGLSLRRAILDAGGFTDLANEDKIYVVNEFDPEGREMRVNQNYRLKPGDIITVKASLF